MRRTGGSYPLIVGGIALAGVLAVWNLPDEAPPAAPPVDAAVPAVPDAAADAEVPVPVLRWRLVGATRPTSAALAACLRAGGWDRVRVLGGGDRGLSITHGPLAVPVILDAVEGGTEVRSPLTGKRHLAVSLHAAVAACGAEGATGLEDAITGLHADPASFPTARRDAGLPLALLVAVEATPTALYTRGLARLGLFDVALAGPDTPRHRRALERAAVAVLLADDPAAASLTLGERAVSLAGPDAAWWPAGLPEGFALGTAEAAFEPPAPAPEAPAPEPVERAPASRPRSAPGPSARRSRRRPPAARRSRLPPRVPLSVWCPCRGARSPWAASTTTSPRPSGARRWSASTG
ncbi:MAG: hypothetical protein R3F60_22005 [bacterium]